MRAEKPDLSVNGQHRTLPPTLEARTSLADYLRGLGLASVRTSCEQAICGVCTVLMDGQPVKSCVVLAVQATGSDIVTLEGAQQTIEEVGRLQEAFHEHHALQCGYCTPAMLLSATAFLSGTPHRRDHDAIRAAISGVLCRCTGYQPIVEAIHEVASGHSDD
jgi:carbon-monoxide dehydrogenase small subunit